MRTGQPNFGVRGERYSIEKEGKQSLVLRQQVLIGPFQPAHAVGRLVDKFDSSGMSDMQIKDRIDQIRRKHPGVKLEHGISIDIFDEDAIDRTCYVYEPTRPAIKTIPLSESRQN